MGIGQGITRLSEDAMNFSAPLRPPTNANSEILRELSEKFIASILRIPHQILNVDLMLPLICTSRGSDNGFHLERSKSDIAFAPIMPRASVNNIIQTL